METKAHHLVIGGFVLLVVAAGFGFVYWMNNYVSGGEADTYHVEFDGSVQGLSEAASVLFNGIRVGTVRQLTIVPEDTRKVRALITVTRGLPVKENSRARITQQGLAGLVALEISPGTPEAVPLAARGHEPYPVIHAERGGAASMLSGVPEALGNANALFIRLNDLIANNEDAINRTVRNVESFTAMLSDNKDDITAIIRDARALSGRFEALAGKLETAIDQFSGSLSNGEESFVAQAQQAAQSFRRLAERLEQSLGDQADGLTRQAQRGLQEFELFMRDGRRLAESLDRVLQRVENNPSSLLFGGSQVPEYSPKQQ